MTLARHGVGPRLREWPVSLTLAGCGAGLLALCLGLGNFRWGTGILGSSVLLAALLRATLSKETAGLLVVRGRVVDVLLLASLGMAILVLAALVPVPR